MPELPEVETVRRSLEPHLVGRRILAVAARRVRLREGIAPASWQHLVGRDIAAVERRGKYLVVELAGAFAVFHLGMSGRLMTAPADAAKLPHTHLVVSLSDGRELRFVDPRRFGAALALAPGALPSHPGLATLGPDALAGAFEPHLLARAKASRTPIRNLLLDQTVLAGVGNIYANEALAEAGIRPDRRAHRISGPRMAALAAAIRTVLARAVAAGGTTLDDEGFTDATGEPGYFAVELAVYGREGAACRRCGTAVIRRTLTGRSIFFCPACQR